jgi:AcrR family transcriptional regulator
MEKENNWYRIAELEKISGVARRTIHFYLQERLLHPPMKTGKTMSYYDDEHVAQLAFIQKSKKQGMPLFAIRKKIKKSHPPRKIENEDILYEIKSFRKKSVPQKKGQKTKETILEAGCGLFRKKGFKNTKISDITKKLEIGKGTFYFYFADKKELFLECIPRIFQELFSVGWDNIRAEKDPLERLKMRARLVLPHLPEFCAILQLSKEAMEEEDKNIREMGKQTLLSIRQPLQSDIEKGIEKGIFRPINSKIAATMMLGLVENIHYLQKSDRELPLNEITENIYTLIISGIENEINTYEK